MSDRTPSSVRTGSLVGDAAAPDGTAPGEPTPPVSATQAIPTGSQKAQAPATGAQKVQAPGTGASAAVKPTGGPPGAPPVPSATGSFLGSSTGAAATEAPPVTSARRPGKAAGRGPRRARLQLRHIDTWSALKISLVLSIALFFIWMVAVGVLYGVLNALGVFNTLNDLFGQIGSASGAQNNGDVVTPGVVFGGAAVIGAINIVLLTALCTVGTFIYNLCSDLVGGLELTLSERD
jgi:Transmembrane domain of unknown function (DUF3566)